MVPRARLPRQFPAVREGAFNFLHIFHQSDSVLIELFAAAGQTDLLADSVKEADAQLLLQVFDLDSHGPLGIIQFFGCL